jgi:hypothetical protein
LAATALIVLVAASCRDLPTTQLLPVQIDPVDWPSALSIGDTATLEIRISAGESGAPIDGPRIGWRSTNPNAIHLVPLPADSGLASQTRIWAVAGGPGSTEILISVQEGFGVLATEEAFPLEVMFWDALVGRLWSTCGLSIQGLAYCWGATIGTDVAAEDPTQRLVLFPITASGILFQELEVGPRHACGQNAPDPTIWLCWGANDLGQLTNGSTLPSLFPEVVNSNGVTLLDLSVSDWFSCGIGRAFLGFAATSIYCWGQPVPATGPSRSDPSLPDILFPVSEEGSFALDCVISGDCHGYYGVSAGEQHACALFGGTDFDLRHLDSVVCWGENPYGQIGAPLSVTERTTADVVYESEGPGTEHPLTSIVATRRSSCVLDMGKLMCWGEFYGPVPTAALAGVTLSMISGSRDGDQVCGVAQGSGRPVCVDTSTGADIPVPATAADGTVLNLASIMTAGRVLGGTTDARHYCGISAIDRTMYCWGDNTFGQVGVDTQSQPVVAPVEVPVPGY